jgi:hypothetical protein
MRRILPASLAVLTLSACAQTIPDARTGGPLPPQRLQCSAEPARWAIGQAATAETIEKIRVDTGSQIARVLHPGDIITMEFSGNRVNVKVNERNAIIGISCG